MCEGPQKQPAVALLDLGAFTQLLTAAQQSGLVANTDAIIAARDREFRAGRYQRAFDVVEGLYIQLNTQAGRHRRNCGGKRYSTKPGR